MKLTQLGVSYFEGSMTIKDLLQRYLSLKCNLRTNTVRGYEITIKTIQRDAAISNMKIRNVKRSDCQKCMIRDKIWSDYSE